MIPRQKTVFTMVFTLLLGLLAFGGAALAADAEQQVAGPIVIVNTGFLNIRSGPGLDFEVVTTVAGGTELPVLGRARNGWFQVSTGAGVGWVNGFFTLPRGNFALVPLLTDFSGPSVAPSLTTTAATTIVPAPILPSDESLGVLAAPVAIVNAALLNVRSGPGTQFAVLATLRGGTEVTVTGRLRGTAWMRVEGFFGEGWINNQFTLFRGAIENVPQIPRESAAIGELGVPVGIVDTHLLNVRSGPGTQFSVLTSLAGGSEVSISGISSDRAWARVAGPFGEGWASRQFIALRGEPGNIPVITDSFAGGIRETPTAIVNVHLLNVRSGPGVRYTIVDVLPGGTELDAVRLASDRVWLEVEGPFGRGWVNRTHVLIRGTAANLPVIQ